MKTAEIAGTVLLCCLSLTYILSCNNSADEPTPFGKINWRDASVICDTAVEGEDRTLIFFLASWCSWCQKLKTETLANPDVIFLINSSFNAVQIDADSDSLMSLCQGYRISGKDLARGEYLVTGYPTTVAVDRSGAELARRVGYSGPVEFQQWLANVLTVDKP